MHTTPDGPPRAQIGGTARFLDTLPASHRARLPLPSLRKIGFALSTYLGLLGVLLWWTREGASHGLSPTLALLPSILLLAFLFETLDSGVGMGFGTALSPMLLLLGYDPLAVVPVLLVSDAATGLLSSVFHHEFKNAEFRPTRPLSPDLRVALLIIGAGLTAMVASVTLTHFALSLPGAYIQIYAGLLVVGMGLTGLLRQRLRPSSEYRPKRLVAFAALAAFNKGIGGGGYGPVITLGEIFSGVYEKSAAAITSLAEGVVSLVGVLTFLVLATAGVTMDLTLLPSVLTGGILAAIAAPYLVRVVPHRIYRYAIPAYAAGLGLVVLVDLIP